MRARINSTDSRGARGGAARRRGVTLLEIILSVVLLTGVATAILAAISYIEAGDGRDRKRLAAHEIGGRLVLQWLDDFDKMPAPLEPIPYNRDEFLYTCDVSPVVMNLNERQRRGETSLQGLDRFLLISVRVYEAVPNGTAIPTRGEELAHVWRLLDPSASRNPDAMDRFGKDPEKINWLLNVILKGVGGGRLPVNGGSR